jgi:hypothetical protein
MNYVKIDYIIRILHNTSKLKHGEKPAREQLEGINDAAKMPVVSDEDSPV